MKNWIIPLVSVALMSSVTAFAAQATAAAPPPSVEAAADGSPEAATRITIVNGSIVSYAPGEALVVRTDDGMARTSTIGPFLVVPPGLAPGRRVTLSTEPATDGSGAIAITRIVIADTGADRRADRNVDSGGDSPPPVESRALSLDWGVVRSFDPGHSITLARPGHDSVTYAVDSASQIPVDLAVGRSVSVRTARVAGITNPVVRKITYRESAGVTKKSSQTAR